MVLGSKIRAAMHENILVVSGNAVIVKINILIRRGFFGLWFTL